MLFIFSQRLRKMGDRGIQPGINFRRIETGNIRRVANKGVVCLAWVHGMR
jgi:hypothetical protein